MPDIKKCSKCGKVKPFSEFDNHKQCIRGVRPDCKDCHKASHKLWVLKNIDKVKAHRKEIYARDRERNIQAVTTWQKNNKERANANKKRYVQRHLTRVMISKKKWADNNSDKVLAIKSKRRARQIDAYPKWVTPDQKKQIQSIYKKARQMTIETGIKHVVDHIWPLKGKTVSGLHVPWNLQVLTSHENSVKNNKLPNMENFKCKI